ncbi:hypothetical protein CRYUN_Cryun02cG0044200 [Craigia yunnanensis]
MGRAPCCDKANVKRGPWSPDEDATLKNYVETHGTGGNWIAFPQKAASQLPGRTDNDVKNYWNTKLKKKLLAGKSSFSISKISINNGFVPANTNVPTQPAASQPCLPKAETYNLDYSTSQSHISTPLHILSDVGYGFSVSSTQNLPLDPVMHFSRSEAIPHLSQSGATLENSHIVTSSQEGSGISDSTSLATESKSVSMPGNEYAEGTGNILMNQFSYEFPYEFVNGIWSQEKVGEVVPSCYDSLADFSHADIKPQGLNQSVANRY